MADARDGLEEAIDDMGWPFLAVLIAVVGVTFVVTSPYRLYQAVKRRTARA